MRRTVGKAGKATGDELWKLYRARLDPDFPKSFKTLGTIYDELSEKLHNADASAEQFDQSKSEIERHFRTMALLPLIAKPAQDQAPPA